MEKLLESDLYGPVRSYLEGLGYDVKGEVKEIGRASCRERV